MLKRLLQLPKNYNFFLFGPRSCGKSTLLKTIFTPENCLLLDLLVPEVQDRFDRNPSELSNLVLALPESVTHVVIDEVQKVPKLLDVVHSLIESNSKIFVLTGSSARKLKHGGANLLAGRAFVYELHPLSFLELGNSFVLEQALSWGMLPKIWNFTTDQERLLYLQAYALTYLKEEIWAEHFVKDLDPFRRFLEVAAQSNGKIVNYNNIAHDVGVDPKTIKKYFSILEDTLIGFFLEPFYNSFRKRLSHKPKFYFFDTGVVRALSRTLTVPLIASTSYYGEVFEHFVILECIKLAKYFHSEYRFSYIRTKDDAEVDLVVERPGNPLLMIEIKSSTNVENHDVRILNSLRDDFPSAELICFSRDPLAKKLDNVLVLPWQEGVKKFFA